LLVARLLARGAEPDVALLAYEIKLIVVGAGVPVWRRVRVSGGLSLRAFNSIVRRAFGWPVSNRYVARIRRPWRSQPGAALVERKRLRLGDTLGEGDGLAFAYEYGWGGEWEVDAVAERVAAAASPPPPECLAGAGEIECTTPDPSEYLRLLRGLRTVGDELHGEAVGWRRAGIEADSGLPVDAAAITRALRRGRYPILHGPAVAASGPRRRRGRFA